MKLLIAALLVASVSCTSSPTEPSSSSSSGTVTLRYGGSTTVAGTRITFADVADSRCPKDVVCVWAGDAAVRLEAGSESVVLHTNATAGRSDGKLAGVTITLVEVKPDPVSSGTKKTDYVVTIRTE